MSLFAAIVAAILTAIYIREIVATTGLIVVATIAVLLFS